MSTKNFAGIPITGEPSHNYSNTPQRSAEEFEPLIRALLADDKIQDR
jgi:hypothetical protein